MNMGSINASSSSGTTTNLLLLIILQFSLLLLPKDVAAFSNNINSNNILQRQSCQSSISKSGTMSYTSTWTVLGMNSEREDEIRQKINQLKKEGRLKNQVENSEDNNKSSSSSLSLSSDPSINKLLKERERMKNNAVMDQYADKIQDRLGKKGKLLGKGGAFTGTSSKSSSGTSKGSTVKSMKDDKKRDDDYDDYDEDDENMKEIFKEEEGLVELVAQKLAEKRQREAAERIKQEMEEKKSYLEPDIDDLADEMELKNKQKIEELAASGGIMESSSSSSVATGKATSGIGGNWNKNTTAELETYRPANGGWGKFPRPKDISKAYGGGKKVGADVPTTFEDEQRKARAVEATREKLRRYRQKVGIDVQSEKDFASDIEAALAISQRAMQRGVYTAAVSALEKVTKYCSTNSKVGGKVFLELAMAYEAVGRTNEAIRVYSALTNSRMEDVKMNAKRLLVGIEAMQFMRDEAKSDEFSRKKASQTFIDTTGLGNIAQNFDKVYNTAYIDLEKSGGFYRKLTENVVRSIREARQILLVANGPGEVERMKVVQALRSYSRSFDEELKKDIKRNAFKEEPVAVIDGVPIVADQDMEDELSTDVNMFNLGSADQMKENILGEWRLQLMADKTGDRVTYYNKTIAWQNFWQGNDGDEIDYESSGPSGFLTLNQKGKIQFEDKRRIVTRSSVKNMGSGAFITGLVGTANVSGAAAATNLQQQIMSVDSLLLITRSAFPKTSDNGNKDYFSVWRRVDNGKYSRKNQ